MERVLGLIPARGGSKGVPRKNLIKVGGKSLLQWSLEAAGGAKLLDRVVVSTDDPEIAEAGKDLGFAPPFMRPQGLGRDDSSLVDVALHAVDFLAQEQGWHADTIVLLQPTSPLRISDDIDRALSLMSESRAPAVVSVCPAEHNHPYWTKKVDEQGILSEFIPGSSQVTRRQDLPPAYNLNGALFIITTRALQSGRDFLPAGARAYIMPPERSLEIDSSWDARLIDLILRNSS